MKDKDYKIILALIIFLFLDLLRPFGYFLSVEFLFLGIIYLSLNYRFRLAFITSLFFGYLKDCLALSQMPLSIIEFPLITLMVNYFLSHFSYKLPVEFCIFPIFIFHVIFSTASIGGVSFYPVIIFFIYSMVSFSLINYLLKKWKLTSSAEYI